VSQEGTAARLTVDPETWNAPNIVSSRNFNVAANRPWSFAVTQGAQWLTAVSLLHDESPYSGVITLTVQPNTTPSERVGIVTITSGNITRTITVTQQPAVILDLDGGSGNGGNNSSHSHWNPHGIGETRTWGVTNNVDWTVTVIEGAPWLRVDSIESSMGPDGTISGGNFTLIADENPTTAPRHGLVHVIGGGITRIITVTQRGAEVALRLSHDTWEPNLFGQTLNVQVSSNVNWRTSVTPGANWLTVTPASGSNHGQIIIRVAENLTEVPRTATVYVTGGNMVRTVVVTQSPATLLTLNRSTWLAYGWRPDTAVVTVTSNVTWSVSSNADWLTISEEWNYIQRDVGMFQGSFRMTVPENPTTSPRTAVVTVTGGPPGQTVTRTILVTQAGAPIYLFLQSNAPGAVFNSEHYFWNAPCCATFNEVTVNANHAWTVTVQPYLHWISVSHVVGNNGTTGGSFRINVIDNTTTKYREAIVTVTAGYSTRNILVHQDGVEDIEQSTTLTLDRAVWNTSWEQSEVRVALNTNIENWVVTVTSGAPWLTVSGRHSEESLEYGLPGYFWGHFYIHAAQNPLPVPRTGVVTVTGGGVTRTVTVTQSGFEVYLRVDRFNWNAPGHPAFGPMTTTFTISSNVPWTVTSNVHGSL